MVFRIAQLTPVHRKAVLALRHTCCPEESADSRQLYIKHSFVPDAALGAFAGKQLVACLFMPVRILRMRGERVRAAQLSFLLSKDLSGHEEILTALLEHAKKVLSKQAVSIAYTNDTETSAFFRQGFSLTHTVRDVVLSVVPKNSEAVQTVPVSGKAALSLLPDLYKDLMSRYDAVPVRTRGDWRYLLKSAEFSTSSVFLAWRDGAPCGYAIAHEGAISECLFSDRDSAAALLAYAAKTGSAEKVRLSVADDIPVEQWFPGAVVQKADCCLSFALFPAVLPEPDGVRFMLDRERASVVY